MIRLRANGTPVNVTATKFPDGTSQVWQLGSYINKCDYFHIDFLWENKEEEILHLLQLTDLIRNESPECYIYLNMPFVPYARQDKTINDQNTFSLSTFASLLNSKKYNIVAGYDVHSKVAKQLIKNFCNINTWDFHYKVHLDFKPNIVFYPDKGAADRYVRYENEVVIYGEKIREPLTGKIIGYKIVNAESFDLKDKKILIIDDICDGGATFITASKTLKELGVGKIGLCVSHGIFSKGLEELLAAGITNFYTTNSLNIRRNIYGHQYEEHVTEFDILGEK